MGKNHASQYANFGSLQPSNFLDIPSLEALEILMKEYAGTIVFITHDKRLLENVADVVYEIRDKKINLKH